MNTSEVYQSTYSPLTRQEDIPKERPTGPIRRRGAITPMHAISVAHHAVGQLLTRKTTVFIPNQVTVPSARPTQVVAERIIRAQAAAIARQMHCSAQHSAATRTRTVSHGPKRGLTRTYSSTAQIASLAKKFQRVQLAHSPAARQPLQPVLESSSSTTYPIPNSRTPPAADTDMDLEMADDDHGCDTEVEDNMD